MPQVAFKPIQCMLLPLGLGHSKTAPRAPRSSGHLGHFGAVGAILESRRPDGNPLCSMNLLCSWGSWGNFQGVRKFLGKVPLMPLLRINVNIGKGLAQGCCRSWSAPSVPDLPLQAEPWASKTRCSRGGLGNGLSCGNRSNHGALSLSRGSRSTFQKVRKI